MSKFGFALFLTLFLYMQNRNTFSKKEHLFGETTVDLLYEKGLSLFLYPYRLMFRLVDDEEVPVRCLVSASKKRFKHAVDRNHLKRQMREAYRLNKHSLFSFLEKNGQHLHLAIHFVGDKIESSAFMQKKMIQLLSKLEKQLQQKEESR